jgi:hypothetical protein
MAALVTCQTETNLCTVCGRSAKQTTFCTLVAQAAATGIAYNQNAREERSPGPHLL